VSALWNEEDPEFANAIAEMQSTLNDFSEMVGLASFAAIRETQDIVVRVDAKTDEIGNGVMLLQRRQTEGFSMIQTNLQELAQSNAALAKAWIEKTKKEDQEKHKRKPFVEGPVKGDPGDKRYKAVKSIKNFFDEKGDVFSGWDGALKENIAQQKGMREALVAHTGEWLTGDKTFQEWV
jgi:hypothetical protein